MNFLRLSARDLLTSSGKLVFNHIDKTEFGTAYQISEKCTVKLLIPQKLGSTEVEIAIFNENMTQIILYETAKYIDFHGEYDLYSVNIPLKKLGVGLFFGKIKLKTLVGDIFAYKAFDKLHFSENENLSAFQLSVSDFSYSAPSDKYGGIIYHIFVDRFARSDEETPKREDAVMIEDWYSEIPEYPAYPGAYLENNTFFGGTLTGITEKLDYLVELGVNLIYLSPIFKAYSNHKYDTGDYMEIDEMLGGEAAFKRLIEEAKKRNVGIILDGVFNHTGADSVYFNKFGKYASVGAYQSKNSPYFSWYDFKNYPDKYTSWWGIDILPRINPNVDTCADFLASVVEKYAKFGVEGFRLDVADELSDEFIAKIKSTLNKENQSSILYGEVWEDASNKIAYDVRKKYYLGNELDGVMNYPCRNAIISFLKYGDFSGLEYLFYDVFQNAPKRIRDAEMNLLGTHDTERILTVLGGEDPYGKTNDYLVSVRLSQEEFLLAKQRLFMAYAISATLPGIPAIFYGDEAGLEGYSDPFNRRTYPWGMEKHEIINFYKKIGSIRRNNSVYKTGNFKSLVISSDLLLFERYENNVHYITAVNNSYMTRKLNFKSVSEALIKKQLSRTVTIEPYSVEIIKTESQSLAYV